MPENIIHLKLFTDAEFAHKIEWEGGIWGGLEYGLRARDLADPSTELGVAWKALEDIWNDPDTRKVFNDLESALEQYEN